MKKMTLALCLGVSLISVSAFAGKTYQCGGSDSDLEVTVDSQNVISVGVTEWNNDYRAESHAHESASVKFKRIEDSHTDDDLSASVVSISRSLLDGEKTGYAVLVGGESGGKYSCTLE